MRSCTTILMDLIDLYEAKVASEFDVDRYEKELILVLELSEVYIQELRILSQTLEWLTLDTQARFDREQGCEPGTGSYSPELKKALKLIGKEV